MYVIVHNDGSVALLPERKPFEKAQSATAPAKIKTIPSPKCRPNTITRQNIGGLEGPGTNESENGTGSSNKSSNSVQPLLHP